MTDHVHRRLGDNGSRFVRGGRTGRGYRKATDGIYYDRDSGEVGFGNKYGERSYNQRPVHADLIPKSGGISVRPTPVEGTDKMPVE